MPMRKSGFSANVYLAGANYSVAITSVASGPLVARLLGPSMRGQYAVELTAVLFAAGISAMGLVTVLAGRPSVYSYDALWYGTARWRVLSLVVGLGLVLPVVLVAHVTGVPFLPITLIALFSALANPFTTSAVGLLTAAGKYKRLFWIRAGSSCSLLLALVLLTSFRVGSATGVVALYVITAHVPAILMLSRRRRRVRRSQVRHVRALLRDDMPPAALYSVLALGNARLDQAILPSVLSNGQIGLYSVAGNYGGAVAPFALTLSSLLMRQTAQRPEHFHLRHQLLATTAASLTLAIAAPWFLPALFGSEFRPALIASYVLCAAGLVQAAAVLLTGQMIVLGHAKKTVPGGLLAFLLIPSCIPLSMHFGITGAALGSLGCYSVDALWQVIQYTRVRQASDFNSERRGNGQKNALTIESG